MRILPLLFLVIACSGKSSSPTPDPAGGGSAPGSGSGKVGSGSAGGNGGASLVAPVDTALEKIAEGKDYRGWKPVSLYLDDADAPIGARFVHGKTGFTLDYLRIESAPQGMLWVTTPPTGDQGEPHTQEHLLLGKGDRGRKLGSVEAMSLAHSSAFTDQWRTAYHFNTVAGNDVFWSVFENQLDALLHPDYTDEEIRREVRNFGVDKGSDGKLRLEEKGTVYNEMVRTYESPEVELYRAARQVVYGAKHPLSYESGGYPDAIRTMTPEDIRKFHAATHHLVNMGMIGAFPRAMTLDKVLDSTGAVLEKMKDAGGTAFGEAGFPAPAPDKAGTTRIVEYPYADAANPGPVMLVWPATRKLGDDDKVLLELFLDAFAGDESTPLYKKIVDSKTRALDIGATGLGASLWNDQGQPITLSIGGVRADKIDDKTLAEIKKLVAAELDRIGKLAPGDAELAALHARMASRATDLRRRMTKFLDSPPRFGIRGTYQAWLDHLTQLARSPGWKKSLTLRPSLGSVDGVLAEKGNGWGARLKAWGLLDEPFAVGAKPSPARRKQLDGERTARIEAELARLVKQYGAKTTDEALQKYQVDYDAETTKIETASKAATLPELVVNPPMTYDDALTYTTDPIAKAPALSATIGTMSSSRVGFALRLDGVDPANHMYLAMLPSLLTDVGIVEGGKVVSSEEVKERLRKEILALSASYAVEPAFKRAELVVEGAGNNADETKLAIAWMGRVLQSPAWRVDNLARMRDLVDQTFTAIRQTTLGPEEYWALDPRDAWLAQQWPVHAHTHSFLAQTYDIFRLRWQLADPQDAKVLAAFTAWLGELEKQKGLSRDKLVNLTKALTQLAGGDPVVAAATKLPAPAQALAKMAGKDLAGLLSSLPDATLADDWSRLVKRIAAELAVGAPKALEALDGVRKQIVGNKLRIYQVGSPKSLAAIRADVEKLAGGLEPAEATKATPSSTKGYIIDRLAARGHKGMHDHLGLVVPSASSGVFANVAPGPRIAANLDEPALIDYLTSNLYTGHGAHSLFMKTWSAGLAYSNGVHTFLRTGWIEWYAERCPLLPQTLRFVAGELDKAKADPNIARYALAFAFASRVADAYEGRTRAMAADLADGITPADVKQFRGQLLALGKRADLAEKLFARMPAVYGRVIPGYGPKVPHVPGQHSFAIGPEKQLVAFEEHLKTLEKDHALVRLYGRDFWVEP